MSYNRGTKRNSFGNRNYNNRSSSGSGSIGSSSVGIGNVGGSGGSRGVNPWESGVMPGRGILPTPNNNLSLNSPQAQLVIASNLLSNLLRTQQDSQPQVPSLLSLGNNMNGPGSNYRNSPNFSGRFNDRQLRGNMKNQRSQPYNKMGNRARDSVAGRRGPSSAQQSRVQSQSGNQRINGNQKDHRNDKSSKPNPASKQNQTVKKEQQDIKTSDNEKADTQPISKSDENDKTSVIKEDDLVDVKKDKESTTSMEVIENEEKSSDETITTNEQVESVEKSITTSPSKKVDDHQNTGKKSEARHAESRYAAVPISQMFCHVCNKHMWDGFSFENHLRGRAHQLMMDKLDESYKLRVDFMRHELKVAEEQRELSLHNSKRRGKKISVDLNVREYCTMCDLNFYGTLSSHRKSDKHQQLKVFLHPRCGPCAKEFPSRIEYDEHCLTPSHMVNAVQTEEQKKTKKLKLPKGESEVRSMEDEEKDSGTDSRANEKDDELPENVEYLLDIVVDMNMTKYKVPSFRYCRQNHIGLGSSFIKEVNGYHCEKCRRFMLTAEDMIAHLRSITHYRNFAAEVKALTTVETNDKNKDKVQDYDDSLNENECKRQKMDNSIDDEALNINYSIGDESTQNSQKDIDKEDGNDKYDPLEADVESEDDERQQQNKEQKSQQDQQNENQQQPQQENQDDKDANDEKNCDQSIDAWGDGDNDNEPEVGNLLGDDDEGEQESLVPLKNQQQLSQAMQQQTSDDSVAITTTSSVAITTTPSVAITTTPSVAITTTPSVAITTIPSVAITTIPSVAITAIASVADNQSNKRDSPNSGNNSNAHSHGKSPRGRGFRGRGGHQRARRSRR